MVKRRLKPEVRKKISRKLKLKHRLKQPAVKARLKAERDRIADEVIDFEDKRVHRLARKRGLTDREMENKIRRAIKPLSRIPHRIQAEEEDIWRRISKGKLKGQFRNRKTKEVKSPANLNRRIAAKKYWAKIKFLSKVLDVSIKEARDSFDVAQAMPELVSL